MTPHPQKERERERERERWILSSLFIYPTTAQLDCSKRMLKFTLKVLLHVSV
jgi:hypothetical protein